MRCGGRGVCGCGADVCAENVFWFQWGGLWLLVGYEMEQQDDAIRYYTQLIGE